MLLLIDARLLLFMSNIIKAFQEFLPLLSADGGKVLSCFSTFWKCLIVWNGSKATVGSDVKKTEKKTTQCAVIGYQMCRRYMFFLFQELTREFLLGRYTF